MDKLYYLFRSYLNTEDSDEKFLLQADPEGDFIANVPLKKIYKRIFNQTVKYNVNFTKTRHCKDYFSFMSHLFTQMGYHGWVILIDETELMGRLGKKARLNAYRNMADFLLPERCPESTFSIFALSASYAEDVIEGKHEYENLSIDSLAEATQSGGYLLRTKIRAAIEFLDQLYQYGKAGKTTINELGEEVYTEDVPVIEE